MFKLSTEFQLKMFNLTIVASYILYGCILFGIMNNAPKYLEWLKMDSSITMIVQ